MWSSAWARCKPESLVPLAFAASRALEPAPTEPARAGLTATRSGLVEIDAQGANLAWFDREHQTPSFEAGFAQAEAAFTGVEQDVDDEARAGRDATLGLELDGRAEHVGLKLQARAASGSSLQLVSRKRPALGRDATFALGHEQLESMGGASGMPNLALQPRDLEQQSGVGAELVGALPLSQCRRGLTSFSEALTTLRQRPRFTHGLR